MNLKDNPEETKFITAILFIEVFGKEIEQIWEIINRVHKKMIDRCKERQEHLDKNALEDMEAVMMESIFLALAIKKEKLARGE